MKVIYHRLAVRDVGEILQHYEVEGGEKLADRFFSDLLEAINKAKENPKFYPPSGDIMRRANLHGFPYHLLYQEMSWGIKVVVVRHHHRSPRYGLRRR